MRLVVAAIGRLKERPGARARGALPQARRADSAGASASATPRLWKSGRAARQEVGKRMIEESIALANVIPDKAVTVILDERGESLDSAALAALLRRWRDDGRPAAVFVIGGDDGLAAKPARQGEACGSPSAPPPGRISSSASCCSNRSIAPSPSFPGIPTIGPNVAFTQCLRVTCNSR